MSIIDIDGRNKKERYYIYQKEWMESAVKALLGSVYVELRQVTIEYDNDKVFIRFYIDREIIEFDKNVLDMFATEFYANMGLDIESDEKCIYISRNKKVINESICEIPIFSRMEKEQYSIYE